MAAGLLLMAWVSACIALTVILAHGIEFQLGTLGVRAHSVWPPAAVTGICLALALRQGTAAASQALNWWWTALPRLAPLIALAAAGFTVAVGAIFGTYVAGGPDSYCYLNQAELIVQGRIQQPQPIADRAPWPNAMATFVPTGHLPAPDGSAAVVPACPTGYPLLVAAARLLAGRAAMFWIVPLLAGLTVWLTFVLARQVSGVVAGAAAALWLAVSPAFLYQVVQPMTDVPAAALWTAAIVAGLAASRRPLSGATRRTLLSGLLTGAALLVRPNLVPLAAVVASGVCLARPVTVLEIVRRLALFAVGVLPFVVAILALNDVMFGGPLSSGYGRLPDLFTLGHVAGNVRRYPLWFVETQTPLVLLAAAAPFLAPDGEARARAWWLLAFGVTTFACYLPYTVWNAWWFLRFVLPAFPAWLVLSVTAAMNPLPRMRAPARMMAVALVLGPLTAFEIVTSAQRAVFQLRDLEARYRIAGEYVAGQLPSNAIVFTVTESGSVRFYSGRQTVRWDVLDAAWLDRSIEFLTRNGYRPYFLFEADEIQDFRNRFGALSARGALDWPPRADIDRQVRIYDPADCDRYRRGEQVATDLVFTRPRRR